MVALRPNGRILTSGALATAVALAGATAIATTPATGATKQPRGKHLDATSAATAKTTPAAPAGVVFGGITPQDWPLVVELAKDGKSVARAVIGVDMTCTSGNSFGTTDGFLALKLSATGRFSGTYGPERIDAGGVPADLSSSMIGRRSTSRTSMRGIWNLKIVIYDTAGTTVADTCESGQVSWTARQ